MARTSSTVAVAGKLTVLDTAASKWRCTAACMRRCHCGAISAAVGNAARTSAGSRG
ncbi:Uncharacterised protein [Mycobacterium tuberculosis]|nr:Uncharacterised protein [Mycobacterium tuberculosis]